jgi:hypothetical protein
MLSADHFIPTRVPVLFACVDSRAGLDRGREEKKSLAATEVRTPKRPARNESLYRLRYPDPYSTIADV